MDRDSELRTSVLYLRQYGEGSGGEARPGVELTPFHSALTTGDEEYVDSVLTSLQDPGLQYMVLNTPLVGIEQQEKRTDLVPRKLIYLSHILPLLGPAEMRHFAREMEYFEDFILQVDRNSKMGRGDYFELPLALACSSGNPHLVRDMLSRGTELKTCDSKSENIIHCLVRLSEKAPQRAVAMYSVVMEEVGEADRRDLLLHSVNAEGHLPVDLAAKLGLPEMLRTILDTDGVYRFNLLDHGLVQLVRYDVTHYESDESKTYKSLLYHLTNFDEHQLERAQKCGLLSSEPFNTWIETKFNSKKALMWTFIVYWLLMAVLLAVSVLLLVVTGEAHPFVLVTNALLALVYLAVEASHGRANLRDISTSVKGIVSRGHIPVTFTFAYRGFQLAFAVLLIVTTLLSPLRCAYPDFVLSLFVLCALVCGLSLLFFMQLQSHVGPLLIVLQKVIFDTFFFFSVMLLFHLSFAVSLYLLHVQVTPLQCVANRTSTDIDQCRQNTTSFSDSFFDALYETFLLMFNVMAPRDILFRCARIPALAVCLYILLLVIVSIVLVNLLIAIMTKRIDEISRMKDDILKLEKVSIVLYMEERVKTKIAITGFRYYHALIDLLCSKFKWMSRMRGKSYTKSFIRNRSDGKVYLYTAQHRLEEELNTQLTS